ncbi:uncharacterized protein LOC113549659 [Rhopalosiphum maidis]|uniref:uncharacterized protein LOC113549659 n=1 Tax=Rhopalosiphum maidis TaxID=43146 RepID=UPI000F006EA1|nr:uncharacterized protein LOC113549659 [Rhopalosiphum maidis]
MFLREHDPELNSPNMLDVYRSDSQKSDSSQRPRVSFNRDVRIKKIGNSDAASIVEALAGDGEGHLVPTPVRREKIKASKRELALEADRVLKQADSVASLHSDVPPRRQQRSKPDGGSLQRKTSFGGTDSKKWNSEGKLSSYMSLDRPKNRIRKREQPTWEEQRHGGQQYRSSTDLTSAAAPPKRRSTASSSGGGKLTRSVSDAGDRDKPLASGDGGDAKRSISLFGTIQRIKTKIKKRPTAMAVDRSAEPSVAPGPSPPPAPVRAKKQLSPIIESSPRDEYFKYSVGGPLDYGGASPPRPVRGHKVDRIVRKLQQQQQQHQQQQQQQAAAAAELARQPPPSPPPPPPLQSSSPDFAHAHNGNEPFSYTATSSPTIVHLPDDAAADRPPPPQRQRQQYRSAGGMDDTWTSYDDLSHRRDALESRLQKRAAAVVVRPQRTGAGAAARARTPTESPAPDTYATVYKKNETLGGGDRYFERKIVTEHRFARRTPRLSGDGAGDDHEDSAVDADHRDRRDYRDAAVHHDDHHHRDATARTVDAGRGRPPTSRASSGMPTIVSRNNVTVVNGPSRSASVYAADKPAKKRSRLDKFKMLFTGGSSASKENKRPSPSARTQYNSSDPESYTSSLRKRYNVFTGTDNNKQGNHVSGNRRTSSPSKTSKPTGNNAWFKSLDRFGKKNKRSKTFTSGSENDDEIRVHRVNDRNNSKGTTRSYHSVGNLNSLDMDHSPRLIADKRHSLIDSSAGSTTEGDSSQKSHKSTVYLHATTVGEIPESRQLHQSVFGAKSRRAASREELSSRNDAFGGGGAQKRTLSRSVSVLAPWAPRHGEGRTVDYDERGRPPRAPSSTRHGPVKATKSDPEESAVAGAGRSTSAARTKNRTPNRASSGEESSLLDEVIIRTTSRTGKLIKDDRSTSRQIGRSMSSANRSAAGGTLTRVKTKS